MQGGDSGITSAEKNGALGDPRPALQGGIIVKNKNDLIKELAELPAQIEAAEERLIERHNAVQVAKEVLTNKEDQAILEGLIDGKNAEIRAAQMRQYTSEARKMVQDAENGVTKTRVQLTRLNNRMAALKAIAGLLKGAD